MYKIFVYGTLKRNFPNFYLNKGNFIDKCVTVEKFSLCLVGERYSPCIIKNFTHENYIIGELFEVNDETMQNFDLRERIDKEDGYKKIQIQVKKIASNEKTTAFCYVKEIYQINTADVYVSNLMEYTVNHSLLYKQRVIY